MKEKKIYKIESENVGKKPNRNYIEYYVNEEKGTVTAVLKNVRLEMAVMFNKKFSRFGCKPYKATLISDSNDAIEMAMKNVPDKLTVTVRCAQEDMKNFNVEFGCSLARFRLLRKMYWYRNEVANELALTAQILANSLLRYTIFCSDKVSEINNSIDVSISEYFSENNLNL